MNYNALTDPSLSLLASSFGPNSVSKNLPSFGSESEYFFKQQQELLFQSLEWLDFLHGNLYLDL
jgi:hypothetical protein